MERFTDAVVGHRRIIILAWVVLSVVGAYFASGFDARMVPGGEAPASSEAEIVANDLGRNGSPTLFLVVTGVASQTGADGQRALGELVDRVSAIPGVQAISPLTLPQPKPGSPSVRVLGVSATGGIDGSIELARRLLAAGDLAPVDSPTFLGGYGAHREELVQLSKTDLVRAERVGIPIVAIVLLLTFGSIWATGIPLVIAMTALLGGLGAAGALSYFLPLSEYITNTASMIGLALSVDYAMFLVQRVRELLRAGSDVQAAISAAMRTTGVAILWSGITVVLAEGAMFVVDSRAIRTAALGLVLVTVCALAGALVGAPIMLGILGTRVLRRSERRALLLAHPTGQTPGSAAVDPGAGGDPGGDPAGDPGGGERATAFWGGWGRRVTGHAALWLAAGVLGLGALAVPTLRLADTVNISPASTMPATAQVRQASDISTAAFGPGVLSPVEVIVRGTATTARANAETVAAKVATDPAVIGTQVLSLDRPDYLRVRITTRNAAADARTHDFVRDLREGQLHAALAGIRYDVGGETAMRIDATDALFATLPLTLAILLAVVMVVLAVALRSVVLPVKAVVLVLMSLAATMGGLVSASTTRAGARLIGFAQPMDLHPIVPVTIVVIVMALATDYEVILLSRIAERFRETRDNTGSIVDGVAHTGRVISSAAAIMVAVFFGFALSEVTPLKQIGVGLALAVVIDATVIRGLLVPASMQLMGRLNWWMPRRRPSGRHRAPHVRTAPVLAARASGQGPASEASRRSRKDRSRSLPTSTRA